MTRTQTGLNSTRRLVYLAMFIALSAVGANIKIPGVLGTPALDSLAAFLAGLILGPANGAIVGALGHMLTAFTQGFPLTIPIHLMIAVGMAGIVALFSLVSRYTLWGGAILGIILNGIAFPALFILIPSYGMAFFAGALLQLLVATVVNIVLAEVIFQPLSHVAPVSYAKIRKEKAA